MNIDQIRQEFNSLKLQVAKIEQLLNPEDTCAIAPQSVTGPFYGIDPSTVGLHILKDKWSQKSYIKAHCDELLKPGVLRSTIAETLRAAPQRSIEQGFMIPDENRTPIHLITSGTERWMEAQLYELFSLTSVIGPRCDLWKGICARQIPLFDAAARAGWGEIDLMAVAIGGHPIVIELKLHKERNPEPPQRPLFEGAAYAVALKKCWSSFWPEWDAVLSSIEFDSQEVSKSQQVEVVLLAPDAYWNHWLSQRQYIDAQTSYKNLVGAFGDENIKVKIFGFSSDENGIPIAIQDRADFLG